MTLTDDITNSDIEYKDEVLQLFQKAKDYLNTFEWCDKIVKWWLIDEFAYILCIFYFEIIPNKNCEADDHIWIIVGDLPSAYIDPVSVKNAKEAVEYYCELMQDWIDHIKLNTAVDECYPISAAPTLEHANMLQSRIDLLTTDFIPFLSDTGTSDLL